MTKSSLLAYLGKGGPSRTLHLALLCLAAGMLQLPAADHFAEPVLLAPQRAPDKPRTVSLNDCVATALARNRALQIERLNPEIARLTLSGAYGYYDPVFSARVEKARTENPGGYDPMDLTRNPSVYTADSEAADGGLTGMLPWGMNYSLTSRYTHTEGSRVDLDETEAFDSYKLSAIASVSQPLLRNFWTDEGRTLIRVNKKHLAISQLVLSYAVMSMINQVQQAYYELLFANEDLKVRQRLLETKRSSLAGVKRQVEVGAVTVLDEKLAQSEVARVEADLITASNAVWLAENVLRTLMGHNLTNWSAGPLVPSDRLVIVPERLELAESWRLGFAQRPDLAQMREDLERRGIELKYYYNQLFPALDAFAGYGRRGADTVRTAPPPIDADLSRAWEQLLDGDAPNHVYGLSLSLPLTRMKERAEYKAGKQLREQAKIRVKEKEELILREVSDAIHNANSARLRAEASRVSRDYAKAALDAEQQKFAGGKSTLFVVFQLQSNLADAESAEVRARADYNKAISQLHFAEGTLNERSNVTLEVR